MEDINDILEAKGDSKGKMPKLGYPKLRRWQTMA